MMPSPRAWCRRHRSAHTSRTSCRELCAATGLTRPPCGVPASCACHCPSSRTPACRHCGLWRRTRWAPSRCSTHCRSQAWSSASKPPRMSASSTPLTWRFSRPTVTASSASCGLRPGRTSRGESAHGPLVESVQHCHRGPLDACRFQGRDAAGPLAAGRLRDGHPLDRTRGIPPSLEAVCQVLQMSLQVLARGRPRLSINARSRLVMQPVLRFAQAVASVDRVPERRQRLRVVPPRCLS